MSVFGVGLPEMAVIAVLGLLIFGPKKLPELGRTLGKTLKAFQSASQEFSAVVMAETNAPETPGSTREQPSPAAVSPAADSGVTGEQHGVEDKV